MAKKGSAKKRGRGPKSAKTERAEIVSYLRRNAPNMPPTFQTALLEIAQNIEDGDAAKKGDETPPQGGGGTGTGGGGPHHPHP